MLKVKYVRNSFTNAFYLTKGKIYDVIKYSDRSSSTSSDGIRILDDNDHERWFYMVDDLGIWFIDYTVEYRNEQIDDILK